MEDPGETCTGVAQNDMGECRMDIVKSNISYLGYDATESYGITWKVRHLHHDRMLFCHTLGWNRISCTCLRHFSILYCPFLFCFRHEVCFLGSTPRDCSRSLVLDGFYHAKRAEVWNDMDELDIAQQRDVFRAWLKIEIELMK